MAICKLCNHENPDGMQFCANCGNVLDVSSAAVSEAVSSATDKPDDILTPVTTGAVPTSSTASITPPQAETLAPVALVPTAPSAGQQGAGPAQGQAPQAQPYVAAQGPNSQYYEPANTVPFNAKDQAAYQQQILRGNRPDYENVCVLALVFGLLGFFFNPLYLVSIAAIVLGIIGHVNNGSKKSLAMVGWILGIASLVIQLFFDFVCAAATCGWGSIVFCF